MKRLVLCCCFPSTVHLQCLQCCPSHQWPLLLIAGKIQAWPAKRSNASMSDLYSRRCRSAWQTKHSSTMSWRPPRSELDHCLHCMFLQMHRYVSAVASACRQTIRHGTQASAWCRSFSVHTSSRGMVFFACHEMTTCHDMTTPAGQVNAL